MRFPTVTATADVGSKRHSPLGRAAGTPKANRPAISTGTPASVCPPKDFHPSVTPVGCACVGAASQRPATSRPTWARDGGRVRSRHTGAATTSTICGSQKRATESGAGDEPVTQPATFLFGRSEGPTGAALISWSTFALPSGSWASHSPPVRSYTTSTGTRRTTARRIWLSAQTTRITCCCTKGKGRWKRAATPTGEGVNSASNMMLRGTSTSPPNPEAPPITVRARTPRDAPGTAPATQPLSGVAPAPENRSSPHSTQRVRTRRGGGAGPPSAGVAQPRSRTRARTGARSMGPPGVQVLDHDNQGAGTFGLRFMRPSEPGRCGRDSRECPDGRTRSGGIPRSPGGRRPGGSWRGPPTRPPSPAPRAGPAR